MCLAVIHATVSEDRWESLITIPRESEGQKEVIRVQKLVLTE